jgi:hypothetical protein
VFCRGIGKICQWIRAWSRHRRRQRLFARRWLALDGSRQPRAANSNPALWRPLHTLRGEPEFATAGKLASIPPMREPEGSRFSPHINFPI